MHKETKLALSPSDISFKEKLAGFLTRSHYIKKLYQAISKARVSLLGYGVFENVNRTTYQKNCLLLYIVDPFKYQKINYYHQNYEQVKILSKILAELEFNVDVIQFNDTKASLHKKYDLIIDIHPGGNDVYKGHMATNCKKIFYSTGSDPLSLKNAEEQRRKELLQRRGVSIMKVRQLPIISADEYKTLDGMLFMGSTMNIKTYDQYEIKNKFLIKNTGYDFLGNKDFSKKSNKSFLFLSGGGQVLKGLDLLLEIFARNPDLHLYVCSKFMSEKDFSAAYHKELFETSNIHPVGFIDITSPEFSEITKECSYVLAPSFSEGQSGAVLAGMSAGLIPIISKECGLEAGEAYFFDSNNLETIERTIKEFSQKPPEWIIENSKKAIQTIKDNHSEKNYYESVKTGLARILNA